MAEITGYEQGTFSWVDLSTTDPQDAKQFYAALFGWSAEDMPAGDSIYTMLKLDGSDVAALAQMRTEMQEQGIPPHWNSYVTVDDVDASTEKAKSLGANVMMEPFDVMDVGRMAVIQDPSGAALMLWQAKRHIGATRVNEPGTLVWNELATRDVEAAKQFYTELFDWQSETASFGEMEYTSFKGGDRQRGGMMAMDGQFPAEVPPHWLVYFAVADTDATVAKVRELGGSVRVEPTDIPEVGRFAVLSDRQGGTFGVIKLINPPE